MFKLTVLALGDKMPSWVNEAVHEYSKRLTDGVSLSLIELPLQKRLKTGDLQRILDKEAAALKATLPPQAYVIALDRQGEQFVSEQLARKLSNLQLNQSHIAFIIGGPEGLHPDVLTVCRERWSLSKLTMPHTIARIVLVEALYRAWCILKNHPYHK